MKKINVIIIICVILVSCKKNYTCVCNTINIQGIGTSQSPYINEETYHVKEKNTSAATSNCAKQYEASGKATGGVNCNVTQN